MSKLYMSNYGNNKQIIENFDAEDDSFLNNDNTTLLKDKISDNQNENKTPSPISAMLYFFILSIFYMIISTILIYTSVANSSTGIAINLIFILLLVLGLYFINMSTIKNLCGSDDENYIIPYRKVANVTFIPWIIVFGTIFFLLELFPGWVRPFSNTIGFLIISFLGVETEFKKYIKSAKDVEKEQNMGDNNKNLVTAIEFLNKNTAMFINEFSTDEEAFQESFEQLKKSGTLKNQRAMQEANVNIKDFEVILKKMIRIKHTIGKGVWYILAGTVVSSISYNILLDIECQKSRKKINDSINNLYSEALTKTGSKWRLMTPEFTNSNGEIVNIEKENAASGSENNLNQKRTENGYNYMFKEYLSISENPLFLSRFNKKDNINNNSLPYIGNDINWGGIVSFTNDDRALYTMENLELQEGHYIAVEVDESETITYNNKPVKYLFYEVIE